MLVVERIVGVAVEIESVESLTVVCVEGQPEFDTLRQVRIRKEMASKRNQVRVILVHNRLGSIGFESTRGDNFRFKDLAQLRRRNWFLTLGDEHVAFDTRFNNVEVRQFEPVQLLCNVIEECSWVAVRHRVPRSARSNSHRDAIAAPHRYHCFHYFQQEAGTVLDRPTIRVRALVASILQEFIGQIAVGGVKFDFVKTRGFRSLGGFAIVLDDAWDF